MISDSSTLTVIQFTISKFKALLYNCGRIEMHDSMHYKLVSRDYKTISGNTPLRKHAYLNILKILQPKKESFQIRILIFFIFLFKTQIVGTC